MDTPGFSRGRERSSCGAGKEEPVRRQGGPAFVLTQAIEKRFGFPVDVIVRDHAYLRAIVED
ncbi:hypothetical protein ABZT17_42945, partial [Streptomyces sp. NPDC005648]